MEGAAGKVPAVVESCCWGGGILLFGTLTTGSTVTVGVLGQAVYMLGCSTKKEKKNLLLKLESAVVITGTWRKVAINLNKFHSRVRAHL